MPTSDTLECFIARVEANAHVEACEEFYTADATMRGNQGPLRVERDAHVATESRRTGDEGTTVVFAFCPVCGTTVHYHSEGRASRRPRSRSATRASMPG